MTDDVKKIECKRCGSNFECNAHAIQTCECQAVRLKPETLAFLEKTTWGCLCANCLRDFDDKVGMILGVRLPNPDELVRDVHYYIDNGYWVFTEYYHMLRGDCCKSGCRHCAYGNKK